MAQPSIGQIERQCYDHGYTISVEVKESGVATVTLKSSSSAAKPASFKADSGKFIDASRYWEALKTATERMLDFEYRSKWGERPDLGATRYGI